MMNVRVSVSITDVRSICKIWIKFTDMPQYSQFLLGWVILLKYLFEIILNQMFHFAESKLSLEPQKISWQVLLCEYTIPHLPWYHSFVFFSLSFLYIYADLSSEPSSLDLTNDEICSVLLTETRVHVEGTVSKGACVSKSDSCYVIE